MKKNYFLLLFLFVSAIISAQIVNIPDANFKTELIDDGFDLNNDGEIEVSEALQVEYMSVGFKSISDLTGIEAFINLETLVCYGNDLTNLDLSSNMNLKVLRCSDNMISTLIVNQSLGLTDLICYNNNISTLDITNNINLEELNVSGNNLTSLDVSNNVNLEDLRVQENNLTSLSITNNAALIDLYMSDNQIGTINLSNNPLIDTINCDNNPLASLDVSENPSLKYLYCSFTAITSLDFTQNPEISFVTSRNSSLQELLFGNNPSLQRVFCENNQLTLLEITGNHNLRLLNCENNFLSKLVLKDLDNPLLLYAQNNANLYCVEVDDPVTIYDTNSIYIDPQVSLNLNCSNDDDTDGIMNSSDHCPNTILGATVDINGCAINETGDDDNDGVINGIDKCPGTQVGEAVNYFGCPLSEIITFLDADFKNRFIHNYSVDSNSDGVPDAFADTNDDGDIQYSEAEAISSLVLKGSQGEDNGSMANIEGLQYFVNLVSLDLRPFYFNLNSVTDPSSFSFTALTNLEFVYFNAIISNVDTLDFSGLSNLNELILNIRPLEANINLPDPDSFVNLNLEGCNSLETFNYYNSWLNIDFCQVPSIKNLDCSYLEGGEPEDYLFDFSCLVNLETLNIDENTVNTLILKNGSVLTDLPLVFGLYNYPDFICVDDLPGETEILSEIIGPNTVINSYCSFVPGGEYYSVSGETRLDLNANDCDSSDELYPFVKVDLTINSGVSTFISNASGLYSIPLQTGNYSITPQLENLDYFTITPNNVSIDIMDLDVIQDFCIVADGVVKDIEIVILPLTTARPGFESSYKIIYKNVGNTTIGFGQILLANDFDLMTEVEFTPFWDSFTNVDSTWHFNFEDLQPFETREIDFTMLINTPTETNNPVNNGDILTFNANYFIEYDVVEPENAFQLNQTVVGSYDPNDKTCLEGNEIFVDSVGGFVHYIIRFENLGTANATNVVVKDVIDESKFDVSTLIPLHASHNFVTKIKNSNEVEFIFENIELPYDDANNDGYILFKIKTIPTLVEGDVFANNAEIYFDFNFPIITNNFETTVAENLSVNDFESNFSAKLYPNPTENILNVSSQLVLNSATIYDIDGRVLKSVVFKNNETPKTIDLEQLSKGVYFIKLVSGELESTYKIVKN